jgi:hypothetical protein
MFGPQSLGDVPAVSDLMIRCPEWNLALSQELAADLTIEWLLVDFDRQQEVGSLLLELPKPDSECGESLPGSNQKLS